MTISQRSYIGIWDARESGGAVGKGLKTMSGDMAERIKGTFQVDVAGQQDFIWGEQFWLQLDPDHSVIQPTVSVAMIQGGAEHPVHIHSGFCEIIYGLEGSSRHWCDQREILLDAGKIGYIRDGSAHRIVNHSLQAATFLSIVYSTIPKVLPKLSSVAEVDLPELAKFMNLDAIAEKFSRSVNMTVTLVDLMGQLLTPAESLPALCRLCTADRRGDCVLNGGESHLPAAGLKINRCRFGVAVIYSPIVVKERLLGYLGCGYGAMSRELPREVLHAAEDEFGVQFQVEYGKLPFINRNQLTPVAETMSLVSASLVQLMIHSLKEKQLSGYQVSLSEEREKQAQLQNSLNQARLKFLESQINPHFLFNTLNTIAQRAEMEEAETSASLTYSLSNLLRLSLGKADSLVTVAEELGYIKDYLFIQETRFPEKFTVTMDIDPDLMSLRIPFMTIMVLIENSILHGFKNIRYPGQLRICGAKYEERAVIEVFDNGSGIPDAVAKSIRELPELAEGNSELKGIGVKNVFLRLQHYYGKEFALEISRLPAGGTRAQIVLPGKIAGISLDEPEGVRDV